MTLLVREAGKTCANAVSEVREAVDFLRYYAHAGAARFRQRHAIARSGRWSASARGTSRSRSSPARSRRRSPPATRCSPSRPSRRRWSPPRRCARCTPPACRAPCCSSCPGAARRSARRWSATRGSRACSSPARPRSPGCCSRSLAGRLGAHGRPVPLIAETGGQNAMVVDSSALAEQVVADVVNSAFDSAGQRCSALRVLCVQRDLAPRLVTMLEGAMRELSIGDTRALAVDVGPVIDEEARAGIERHIEAMHAEGRRVVQHAGRREATRPRQLRRADGDRDRAPRRARARGVRPGAARAALRARGPRRRCSARSTPPATA